MFQKKLKFNKYKYKNQQTKTNKPTKKPQKTNNPINVLEFLIKYTSKKHIGGNLTHLMNVEFSLA